jgi:hypothetical protein
VADFRRPDDHPRSGGTVGNDCRGERPMIFVVVNFETKPEWTGRWPELVVWAQ